MRFSEVLLAAATLGHVAAQSRVLATGPTTGGVQERKNLNDLCGMNGPERTLYFRALQRMQAEDMNDPLSWFQIAGIHGRPYTNWNGESASSGGTGRGYCLHTDIGFLPWHRVYLAVFEQSLVQYAIEIANEYPTSVRATYVSAAERLRAPYWDWAADYNIPSCASASTMSVYVPGGSGVVAQSITNPLLSFRFPSGASQRFGQVVDSSLSSTATVRCSAAAAGSELAGDNLKDQVYSSFTRSTTFSQLSAGTSDSVSPLEQPHNAVHVDAACGNHFSSVGAAGFDPLFMLHHCNVDRLWAIWQEIYSTSIPSGSTTGGSWSINSGSSFSMNTQMSPWLRTSSSRWTPAQAISTTTFGYVYPGIDVTASTSTRRANANALVNRLYSPTGSGSGNDRPVNSRRPTNPRRTAVTKREEEEEKQVETKATGNSTSLADSMPRRFFAKITVDTNKLPTMPITMKFYVGSDIAGSYTLLNAPQDTIAKGEVPLHRVLKNAGYNDKYTYDEMEDKIEEDLQIVFLLPDDTVVDPASVEGAYTVDVESAELIPNSKITDLPSYGKAVRRRIKPGSLLRYPAVKGITGKKTQRRRA